MTDMIERCHRQLRKVTNEKAFSPTMNRDGKCSVWPAMDVVSEADRVQNWVRILIQLSVSFRKIVTGLIYTGSVIVHTTYRPL